MVTTTAREENGEFCVAVAPATRTAGNLTQLVKGAGCEIEPAIRPIWPCHTVIGLIGFNLARLKGLKGDELRRNVKSCFGDVETS